MGRGWWPDSKSQNEGREAEAAARLAAWRSRTAWARLLPATAERLVRPQRGTSEASEAADLSDSNPKS